MVEYFYKNCSFISFSELPRQIREPAAVMPNEYQFVIEEDVVPELQGTLHGVHSNLVPGMDVCVYTPESDSRPWLGRVTAVYPETSEFMVHWYQGRNNSL